jgi:hypothetical protein
MRKIALMLAGVAAVLSGLVAAPGAHADVVHTGDVSVAVSAPISLDVECVAQVAVLEQASCSR